ncbi:group II intron maturase-specific domain-containing protein [Streptomyces sp. NPDC050287]|uniref:group II intron maturase-specific domain-containing protein n=1 Tax=Streptomyces sp. NPDC050287 TaxID=3365608 RepID=UPI0037BB95D8
MPACWVGCGNKSGSSATTCTVGLAAVDETGAGQVQGPHRSSPGRDEVGGRHRRPAPVPSGWGNYFRTGNAADKFIELDRYVAWRLKRLLIKKQGPQPTRRTGGALDPDLVPRPGASPAHGHHPLPEGSVTMHRRPSARHMRENRTYGLKGGWGTRTARRRHRRP